LAFFFGAIYLFLINSLFICLSTLAVVRLLRFERVVDLDPDHARRLRTRIAVATMLAVIPSLYIAWRVVQESRYESAGRRYILENLMIPNRTVINTSIHYGRDSSTIEATILGRPLAPEMLDVLRQRLESYGLQRTRLVVHQPDEGDVAPEQLGAMVRTGILEDLYRRNETALEARDARIRVLESEVVRLRAGEKPISDVARELVALFPNLHSLMYGKAVSPGAGEAGDSARTVLAAWRRLPTAGDRRRIQQFLAERLQIDSIQIYHVSR
jgi:hypothetical protein